MSTPDHRHIVRVNDADVEWLRMTATQLRRLDAGRHGWRMSAADRFSEVVDDTSGRAVGREPRDALWLSLAANELRAYDRQFRHRAGACGWPSLAADALSELSERLFACRN